jgi:hypothetical protein
MHSTIRLRIFCPKELQIKTYKTVLLPVAFYECKTWFFILEEQQQHRLRVYENWVLRIYGHKKEKLGKTEKNFFSTPHATRKMKSRRMTDTWYVWGKQEVHTQFQ